jgi:hypothetical protein
LKKAERDRLIGLTGVAANSEQLDMLVEMNAFHW